MSTPLRLVLLEDDPADAELILHELRRVGFDPVWRRVDDEASFRAALREETDLVLADFTLPQFSALDALRVRREEGADVPIIIVTGNLEESALECVHEGAADYLLKDRLGRLGPAVERALERQRLRAERRRTEAHLRASEERFRTLVESMEDVVFSMDRDLRFVEMFGRWDEQSWVARAGWSREHLVGKTIQETFGPDAAGHEGMYRRALAGEHVVYEWATVNKCVHRHFQTSLSPMRAAGGDIEGLVGVGRDITERKRIESQLLQAQKLESIGQLAAGIAHEINTPIQFVGDNLRFLADSFSSLGPLLTHCREAAISVPGSATDDLDYLLTEVPSAIAQSLEGVDRVARIVRAMKAFSHPDSGEKCAVDLNAALDATVTVARNEWKYVADVRTDYAAGLPPVHCLPGEMNQVFLNLLVNAAHAVADALPGSGAEKGLITITTRHDAGWAEIRIADTGTGIPADVAGRIFDPFFTTKPVGKGTGQGLTIAHAVVVGKHQGTLTFDTELGRGTTFVIRLPVDGEAPAAARP
jgi:PAS domain S-box-containing protein